MDSTEHNLAWYEAEEGAEHAAVIDRVQAIEEEQSFFYERCMRLDCLYDPYLTEFDGGTVARQSLAGLQVGAQVSQNVIATAVDTVTALIAATKIRVRFLTDGGDWSTQRQAKRLEYYAEGLGKLLKLHAHTVKAFKWAALKGTAFLKVWADKTQGKIRLEYVPVDNVIVDESACRDTEPREMHQRMFVDADVLKAYYPDHKETIDRCRYNGGMWRTWAGYRPLNERQVVVVESWSLPIGEDGSPGYMPGLNTVCIEGATLYRAEWHRDDFPFATIRWSERRGFYGLGMAERIAGHQRTLNKMHWTIDRRLERLANPITYVNKADARMAVLTRNSIGAMVPYTHEPPVTVIPKAVSGETYHRLDRVGENALEEVGVSRMAATSRKPGGIESGAALREYRDVTTQRHAVQEANHEQLNLDTMLKLLRAAKELGDKAPKVLRRTSRGVEYLDLSKIDIEEATIQIAAASNISRTPAGRMASVLEWAQAGVINVDETRRLLNHPDLEHAISLHTAALEDVERNIESILDGELAVMPEPFQNLAMVVWRGQQALLLAKANGAPEEILEELRLYVTQAADMIATQQPPEQALPPPPPMPAAGDPAGMAAPPPLPEA